MHSGILAPTKKFSPHSCPLYTVFGVLHSDTTLLENIHKRSCILFNYWLRDKGGNTRVTHFVRLDS